MTLATICTNALKEIGGFEVPSAFYGNTNLTARQCVALVNREGKTLERENRWSELINTHTFATVDGTANYDLPVDFRAFANMSQWDRTNARPLYGPTSGMIWQYRKSGIGTSSDLDVAFRIQNNDLYLDPTPSSVRTIAFDYYSSKWVTLATASGGFTVAVEFASDNDTARLDEELLTLGLKWRFLQAKGLPFEAEYREYETMKTEAVTDNGGKGRICLGRGTRSVDNIPDTGFGL